MSADRGRALLGELVGAGIAAQLEPGADLVRAGVNSGELVRLALLIEERYQVELSSDDMGELRTLDGIETLLRRLEDGR
jgi:acyl carrier protein